MRARDYEFTCSAECEHNGKQECAARWGAARLECEACGHPIYLTSLGAGVAADVLDVGYGPVVKVRDAGG